MGNITFSQGLSNFLEINKQKTAFKARINKSTSFSLIYPHLSEEYSLFYKIESTDLFHILNIKLEGKLKIINLRNKKRFLPSILSHSSS